MGTAELDGVENVIGLTPDDPLDTFAEIWYQVFVWTLFASIFVHTAAAGVGFCALRRHKQGRWIPLVIFIMGIVSPCSTGILTSVVVAFVYTTSGYAMAPFYALLWGLGQTCFMIFFSFSRILATL